MNTVGKILVIMNFLFAVVVGAFLVVDFVARANWKTAYEDLKKDAVVIRADREQHSEDSTKLRNEVADRDQQLKQLKLDMLDQQTLADAKVKDLQNDLETVKNKAKDADLTLTKALTDIERLKVSETELNKIIKERETTIIALQDDVKKFRTEAIASDNLAKQVQDRNTELLEQNAKLNVALARKDAGVGGDAGASIRLANQPNPPSTMVKGKVERVNSSDAGTLVKISVGTDHGVNKGNTMEVFRTAPAPKYLGMVRILDAEPRSSTGRLEVPTGASRPQLLEGDQVWSQLK